MTAIVALIVAPLILLTLCFAVEVMTGLRPLQLPVIEAPSAVSTVIVVPAHDEAAILRERLAALSQAANGQAHILLVADNCSDNTADIARSIGVETIARFDPDHRGKGFALDFARAHLEASPPEVVIIVDADCAIDSASVGKLIARCAASGDPQQATNLQAPAPAASPPVQISTFAFYIKNVIRQRALQRIASRVNLLGTGMALPWNAFARAELATPNIVEDLKLGQELAAVGHGPKFAEDATVWSSAETESGTLSQRGRWEGGFLHNASHVAPGLLLRSLGRLDGRGAWAAINLMIPPFALLIVVDLVGLIAAAAIAFLTGADQWPVLLLGGSLCAAAVGLFLAWASGGSRFVSARSLSRAPLYLLWKLPMYIGFALRGVPKDWVRTRREREN